MKREKYEANIKIYLRTHDAFVHNSKFVKVRLEGFWQWLNRKNANVGNLTRDREELKQISGKEY